MIFSYLLNMQSHPSWVCGLKLGIFLRVWLQYDVTPFVGVWIETIQEHHVLEFLISHTLRGCVDWNLTSYTRSLVICVTPFVGVWIETVNCRSWTFVAWVTPFVGVWIETYAIYCIRGTSTSHPSWVCGLKLRNCYHHLPKKKSHPSWVCGLKLLGENKLVGRLVSHPSWVCGLKRRVAG